MAPPDERFCPDCGLPLVPAGTPDARRGGRREIARRIKPQLAEGPLVRVAGAANQAEAEFIQALLLEAGVPSTVRRAAGFDVPDFLAAGPRDVLVAASGVDVARDVLLQSDLERVVARRPAGPSPARLALVLLAGLVLLALIAWAGTALR
ncbi:MAG: hypothetical protein IRZ32_09635 [Solirubrobacteraceae bacterium]|nr:hypothetical protein [Solirubrobacteraceae bacterium]